MPFDPASDQVCGPKAMCQQSFDLLKKWSKHLLVLRAWPGIQYREVNESALAKTEQWGLALRASIPTVEERLLPFFIMTIEPH